MATTQNWWEKDKPVEQAGQEWWAQDKAVTTGEAWAQDKVLSASPAAPTVKPEDQSVFRRVADVPLQFQKGFSTGIRLIADAFGADSDISKNIRSVEDHLAGLMSAQSKKDSAEMARIMKDAEDKGLGAQVVAGLKALAVAPIDTVVNALGTTAPTIIAGVVGGLPAAGVLGTTMGLGTVKSAVYEATKEVLADSKLPPAEIEARAIKAQEYIGPNIDMIALGGGLGLLESITGSQAAAKRIVDRILVRGVTKEVAETTSKKTMAGAAVKGAFAEATPEFFQGAQEQVARNVAQQREGFNVPTMRGVVSQGVLEAGAGAMMGGVTGPIELAVERKKVGELQTKIDALQNTPPPPGSDEDRVLKLAAEIQARGNVDRQTSVLLAMQAVAKENTLSEKVDGPKVAEATGNAPLFVFDTPEQAQERVAQLKLNRPKDNFEVQGSPDGKFAIYKVPVETTGAPDVTEPIAEAGGISPAMPVERGVAVPAGGPVAPVAAGLDTIGAVAGQPIAGEAVQPSALTVPEITPAVEPTPQPELTAPAPAIEEEPSVTETPEAVQAEEERQEVPAVSAAPESEEVLAEEEAQSSIDKATEAIEELLAASEKRTVEAETREKGQAEPPALRRMTQKASEKLEAAITGKSGLISTVKKLDVAIDRARSTLEAYGGEEFDEELLRKRAETTDEEFDQEMEDMRDTYAHYNGLKALRAQALRRIATFESDPTLEGHPSKAKALDFIRTLPYEDKLTAYTEVSEEIGKRKEQMEEALTEPKAPTKAAAPPVVTVKKRRKIEAYTTSEAAEQGVEEVKAGGTPEERKIQSELTGKTLLEAADWAVRNAPDRFAKHIAERVRARIGDVAKRGVKLEFDLQGESSRNTGLYSAKGLCNTDWEKNTVTVRLNGVPVMDNQNGYPSGMNYITILHELLHAALDTQTHFLPQDSALGKELLGLYNTVIKHFNTEVRAGRMTPFMERIYKDNINALKNPYEIISWGLTDADMQKFLSSIKVGDKTAFDQVVEWIRDVLGISPDYLSALDQLVRTTDKMFSESMEDIASRVEASGKFKYSAQTSAQQERNIEIRPAAQARVPKRLATSLTPDPAFNKFSGKPVTEALSHIATTGNPFEVALATRLLAKDNRAGIKDTKFHTVSDLEAAAMDEMEGAAGLYVLDGKKDDIYVRESGPITGINNQIVLHEATHATVNKRLIYAMYAEDLGLAIPEELKRTTEAMTELMDRTRVAAVQAAKEYQAAGEAIPEELVDLVDGDAFHVVTEFVAYGMTDPYMQNFLRENVVGVVTRTNGFSEFVRQVMGLLGLTTEHVSGLRDLIEYTDKLAASINIDAQTAKAIIDTRDVNQITDIQAVSKAAKKKEFTSEQLIQKIEESGSADQLVEELGSLSVVAKNPKLWGEFFRAKFTDINIDAMNVLLAAMPTEMVVSMGVNKGIVRLADVDSDVREVATMRTKLLNRVQEISVPWIKLSAPVQKQLGKVMSYATLSQIDPDKEKGTDKTLDDMYNALTPEARAVYKTVRDFYQDQYDAYRVLLERAAERMGGKEGSPETLTAIKALYEVGKTKGPYFPLMRYGQFYARFGKGDTKEFYMFESAGLRDAFVTRRMAELAKKGETRTFDEMMETDDVDRGNDVDGMRKEMLKDNVQLRNMFDLIDKASNLGDAKARESLKDQVYQMQLLAMPEASMRKHFIHRKGVTGFSGDALRNFLNSGTRMASQMARVRYSADINNNLDAAKESLKGNPEKDKLAAIIKEVEARVNDEMNPPIDDSLMESLARKTNKIAFVYLLTSVKSAANQMFSIVNFSMVTLAARHGWGATLTEMSKYMALGYGQLGIVKKNADGSTSWVAPTVGLSDRVAKDPNEMYAYQRMQDMGISDMTRTYDLFMRRGQPSVDYNSRWNKVTNMMGALFHHSERISREVTFMTSFRLSLNKGMTKEQAVAQAVNDTNTALFDYSAWNRPRILRPAPVRIVAQFKQFPMYVTLYLARNGYNMIKSGATLAERKEAATMLFGTLGMTGLMAGASGMVGYSAIMGTIQGIRNALRDAGEEDPLEEMDFEMWFRNVYLRELCGDTKIMGMKLSELIDSGVLNTATGLDVASGISLNNMWFHDTAKANTWKDSFDNTAISLMGPGVSVGKQVLSGIDDFNNGDFLKAIEKFSPAFVRGSVTSIRYAQEGVKSSTGAEIKAAEEFTDAQLIAQSMGFRTTGLAQIMNNNFALQQMINGLKFERGNLLKQLDNAISDGSEQSIEEAVDNIDDFGDKYPTYRIKYSEIASSMKAREKLRSKSEAGMYLDKRAADFEVLRERAIDNLESEAAKK